MELCFDTTQKKATSILLKIVGFLLVAGLISVYLKFIKGLQHGLGFVPLFNLDGEYNIPAFYSAFAIWICAALLWYIFHYEKPMGNKQAIYWKALSCIFVFLGFDELSGIHENFGRLAPLIWQYVPELKISRKWVIPFSPFLLAFAIYFIRFYLRLSRKTKIQFSVAAIVYLSGAIGIEILGAWYSNTRNLPDLYRALFSVIEEGMEMVGIVIFIRALLVYIHDNIPNPAIEVLVDFSASRKNSSTTVRSVTRQEPSARESLSKDRYDVTYIVE
jgi:hypothetical protein